MGLLTCYNRCVLWSSVCIVPKTCTCSLSGMLESGSGADDDAKSLGLHEDVKNLGLANENHGFGCRSAAVPGARPRSLTSSLARRLSKGTPRRLENTCKMMIRHPTTCSLVG